MQKIKQNREKKEKREKKKENKKDKIHPPLKWNCFNRVVCQMEISELIC